MNVKYATYIFVFGFVCGISHAYNHIGIITKKGDEVLASIVEQVLKEHRQGDSFQFRILRETVEKEDTRSYHRAFCRLIAQDIIALVSPASEPQNSILAGYSFEYKIPFLTTEVPEITSGLSSPLAVGIRPSTTRAVLGLFQHNGWKDVVYLYDHEYGTEKLHMMILLGHRILKLTLDGILKVDSAEQANWYLQRLDRSRSYGNKVFHVILDTEPSLARDIIWRHVNDVNVRKRNFHFLLSQPTTDQFWTSEKTAFGPVNVTAFTIKPQLENISSTVQSWINNSTYRSDILAFYYHDAALALHRTLQLLMTNDYRLKSNQSVDRDCFKDNPSSIIDPLLLQRTIREVNIRNGATGRIKFQNGLRTNFELNITQISALGYYQVGTWADGVLRLGGLSDRETPKTLPLIQNNNRLQITTKIKPPYMMIKKEENDSHLAGNDRFEGYLKDVIDLITQEMDVEYEISLAEDGDYGRYDKSRGKWTGMIGEVIQGKADLAASDIAITGQRQRVVDFTDPYETISYSLVMKKPLSIPISSSMFFFVKAFSFEIWICIIFSIVLFGVLFHIITMLTGAPDSIESASGIWGRKHAIIVNAWFTAGSSLLQGTGVYPRSISSRLLSGIFWLFTSILSALFIASIASQILTSRHMRNDNPRMTQLKDMSLEALMLESVSRGWPKLGIVYPSTSAIFVKKSKIIAFKKFQEYLEENPGVKVATPEEGIKRVRESAGNYMILMDSLQSDYAVRRRPCDIIATHDSINYAGYGFATRLGSQWTSKVNNALNSIQNRGILGHLHRKWWIDSNECNIPYEATTNERTVHVFTGLLTLTAIGFVFISIIFAAQYIRKNQNKESRRQQLSFEDMTLGQTFPAPPPELLAEPTPVLNVPEYDRKTLL